MLLSLVVASSLCGSPNIVFLHDESTDGRLYKPDAPMPIPHINALQARGVTFTAGKKHAIHGESLL